MHVCSISVEANCLIALKKTVFDLDFVRQFHRAVGELVTMQLKNVNKTEKCSCLKDFNVKDNHTQTH